MTPPKQSKSDGMFTLVDGQLLQMLAYAMMDHAEIVSGAYKLRKTQRGCEKTPENQTGWRDETEEEKLQATMQQMSQHCRWISWI